MGSKKFLIAVLLATVGVPAAHAQMTPRFGAKVGLGISKFTGDITGSEFGFGFGVGPTMSLEVDQFSLVTDLLFNRRVYGKPQGSTKTWDLQIPVLARFYVDPMFFIQAGPSFSFGLGSYSDSDGLNSTSIDYGVSTLSRFDFGVLFGAGTEFALDSGAFQVEARFNWGLRDRRREETGGAVLNRNIKTIAFDVMAGYLF